MERFGRGRGNRRQMPSAPPDSGRWISAAWKSARVGPGVSADQRTCGEEAGECAPTCRRVASGGAPCLQELEARRLGRRWPRPRPSSEMLMGNALVVTSRNPRQPPRSLTLQGDSARTPRDPHCRRAEGLCDRLQCGRRIGSGCFDADQPLGGGVSGVAHAAEPDVVGRRAHRLTLPCGRPVAMTVRLGT